MARLRRSIRYIFGMTILALLIYAIVLTAGRWDWIEFWIFLATYVLVFAAWSLYLKFANPELLQERITAFSKGKNGTEY